MKDQALTARDALVPAQSEFQILQALAKNAVISGLYNSVGNEQKILMILLAANELGIKPMQALNGGIWNIQGKIEISARLMTSMIRRAHHSLIVKSISDKECTLEGKRSDNGDSFCASFTIEEAHRAGLVRPGSNWIKYPQDMLYARAISRLARRLFPDVIGTAYVEGEIKGEIITVENEIDSDIDRYQFYDQLTAIGYEKSKIDEYIGKLSQTFNKTDQEIIKRAMMNMENFKSNYVNWLSSQS